jgi:hypothetical protein
MKKMVRIRQPRSKVKIENIKKTSAGYTFTVTRRLGRGCTFSLDEGPFPTAAEAVAYIKLVKAEA